MKIKTKEDLYCITLPIIRGLEERNENPDEIKKLKCQVSLLGLMLEAGKVSPQDVSKELKKMFEPDILKEGAKICSLERDEISKDFLELDELIVSGVCDLDNFENTV